MDFIGTHLEYIEVERTHGKTVTVAKFIPVLKADPDVVSIISAETGEVFYVKGHPTMG